MRSSLNICTFYLIVVFLASIGTKLFPLFLTKFFSVIVIAISIYYAFEANMKFKPPLYFKALNILIILFTIYGVANLVYEPSITEVRLSSNTHYLVTVLISLLPVYPFYVFTKRGLLTENSMNLWFLIFLALSIYGYLYSQAQTRESFYALGIDREEFTNNASYSFVGLLPALVLYRKKRILQYLLFVVCAFFIISGVKRGAIFTAAVCFLWFFINNFKTANTKKNKLSLVSLNYC